MLVPRSTQWARENKEKAAEQQRRTRATLRGAANGKVSAARQRAKNKGLAFDIDIDFVVDMFHEQEGRCALTGREMTYRGDKGSQEMFHSFSIDRVDSSKGYTRDNIQLLCWGANSIKSNMSTELLFDLIREIYEFNDLGDTE
jgi:5-methylcytosine-specific restriction endonuclease McrA